jgi:hypothetical protein
MVDIDMRVTGPEAEKVVDYIFEALGKSGFEHYIVASIFRGLSNGEEDFCDYRTALHVR